MIDFIFRRYVWSLVLGVLAVTHCTGSIAQLRWLEQARTEFVVDGRQFTEQVTLPYQWDGEHPRLGGLATFHFEFSLPTPVNAMQGLFFPRVGNAYEVWLNGTLLERRGDLGTHYGPDLTKTPRLVFLAPGALRQVNALEIKILADPGRKGGLSGVALGPHADVQQAYDEAWRKRVFGLLVVSIFSALVGLLGLALWFTHADCQAKTLWHRDRLFLYSGIAELCWALRVGDSLLESPPLPWPWWGVVPVLALGGWACCTALLCVEVAGWQRSPRLPWFKRYLALLMLVGLGLGSWALVGQQPAALTAWYSVLGLTFLIFTGLFVRVAMRQGATLQCRFLAAALLLNISVALLDLYKIRIEQVTSVGSNLYYSSMAFGLVVGIIVIDRFRSASRTAYNLMSNLTHIVQLKEAELADSYQRLEVLARQQERTQERSRILRDMHDGVGAHISTAIRQLQSGKASDVEVLHTLRESLDQLKLSIDAMNLPAGDVTALLANLRYRLEPRLKASDIDLQWQVEVLDVCPRLDDKAMRHLLFMVYEAISNVLQHSHATVLRIESVQTTSGCRISLTDNGNGFDVNQPKRKGLQSMQERAYAIRAELTFQSTPGQTVIAILIPP